MPTVKDDNVVRLLRERNGGGLVQLYCMRQHQKCLRPDCPDLPVALFVTPSGLRGVCSNHLLGAIIDAGAYEEVDILSPEGLVEAIGVNHVE